MQGERDVTASPALQNDPWEGLPAGLKAVGLQPLKEIRSAEEMNPLYC